MRIRLFFLLAILMPSLTSAQDVVALKKEVSLLVALPPDTADKIDQLIDNLWKEVLVTPDADAAPQEVAKILAFSRGDLQTGASSAASGSTSAVVAPLLPAIFGFAFENGAITRSVSGSTVTLKANPAMLVCAAKEPPGSSAAQPHRAAVASRTDETCRTFWRRVGLTASFDTSRGDKDPQLANLHALGSEFSELTVRYELVNHRTVRKAGVEDAIKDLAKAAEQLATDPRFQRALEPGKERLLKFFQSADWPGDAADRKARVSKAIADAVAAVALPAVLKQDALDLWLQSLTIYDRIEARVASALAVTLDYSLQRPDVATEALAGGIVPAGVRPPDLHVGRMVAAKGGTNWDFTANLSAAFFGEKREGMGDQFRDVRAGIETKLKLRKINDYGRPTLSFAALYVFLNQEPLGLGITAFNDAAIKERGHIVLFQSKFEMPTANNAVRIPLSLTVSNRTELIKEQDVRGQIGLSFNLDALFANLK